MASQLITSAETVVPVIVHEVVVLALCLMTSVVVVRSAAWQLHPLGAVGSVIVTVQVPVVPEANLPAVAPPTVAELVQPLAVNFVPPEISPPLRVTGPTV